jgi:carboxyl-terminal processing protease
MKTDVKYKYLPILIGATLALGILIGAWLNGFNGDHFLVENSSKTKINKLIDFIDN